MIHLYSQEIRQRWKDICEDQKELLTKLRVQIGSVQEVEAGRNIKIYTYTYV